MKCRSCNIEITSKNRVLREGNQTRKSCRQCENKRNLIWSSKNRKKRRISQLKYSRKLGVGILYPCITCGKLVKKKGFKALCSDECRFLSHIKRKVGGCWEWQSSLTNGGYGKFTAKGRSVGAHRFSYVLYKGEIGRGQCVCHTCDNKKCVNPDHLWVGSHKDNALDCVKKGRHKGFPVLTGEQKLLQKFNRKRSPPDKGGEKHHLSRLKDCDIRKIRSLHTNGLKQKDLANKFKVGRDHISRIINFKVWKHLV